MNPYQVIWYSAVWKKLQNLRDMAAQPAVIDAARTDIEQALGSDPHRYGIPLSEGLWKYELGPLRVFYSIESPRQRVLIRYVQTIR